MGQFFRVNGDYNIKVKDGGTIKLDTGASGDTIITGNLTVQGDVTSVSSTNLEIEDRIITLNDGERGPGVTLVYSGMEIDRGTYVDSTVVPRAALVWNETNPPSHSTNDTEEDPVSGSGYWMVATGQDGAYGFRDSNLKLRRILTDSATDSGDLTLIGTGTGVVKVAGTENYRLQVTDANDIPNKDYVDFSILNNPTFQIRAPQGENTRVIIADTQVTPNNASTGGSLAYYYDQTGYPTTESTVGFFVDGVLAANIYADRVQLQQLEFDQTEILTVGSGSANIKFTPHSTGKVEINASLQLNNDIGSPAIVSGSHVIYSRPESTGKSGIYFVNTENTRDELVSKNRALLFSMLF
jgi:hypothetical protein